MNAAEKFRLLLSQDSRYDAEAYNFIYEALDWTLKNVVKNGRRGSQHVTGQELMEGARQYAIDQFGCLASTILSTWGVHATDDLGEIVFNLVAHDLMGKQESDTKRDFQGVYDFNEVFELSPIFSYEVEKKEWSAVYVARSHYSPATANEPKKPRRVRRGK